MPEYKNTIQLVQNARGIWDLDPFKGCEDGMNNNSGGCWGTCYAAKIAKARGYDFGKSVYRYFESDKHLQSVCKKLIGLPFVRLGVMCDPSHDWEHTLDIVGKISPYNQNIVIITKHWKEMSQGQLEHLTLFKGLCINTSVSALDTQKQIEHRVSWYNRLKAYCNSVLRVNTADFTNSRLKELQNQLLTNTDVIDNILRFPLNHPLVKGKVINLKKYKFLNSDVYASKHDDNVYFGHCSTCPDQCGIK